MVTLFYDAYLVLSKVYREGAYVKQALTDTQIEEINRAKTTKLCYGVLDKDVELSYYINCLCDKSPKATIKILLKIAMYSHKYLLKADYVVTNSIVELSKKMGKGGVAGFINGFLRKFYKAEFDLPKDRYLSYSVKYSYPIFAVKKLINDYGESLADQIMAYDEENTFLRFNGAFNGEEYLNENGYSFKKTVFQNLFNVKSAKINEDFYKGVFTFQSIGSVAICDIISGGERLLDACAAPGGKSVLLSEKFSHVTACELHLHRAKLIESYAKRMTRSNVEVCCCDSSVFNRKFDESFDAVLCDVPCSGYGTLKVNPDIKLKDGSHIEELTLIQYQILDNCARYLKKGGTLYYSTCSIFVDENDGVVGKFLQNNSNFSNKKIESSLGNIPMKYGLQFLPNLSDGAGFYIAALIKK